MTSLTRALTSHVEIEVAETADLVLSVAVAQTNDIHAEQLRATLDGEPVEVDEIPDRHGTRLHRVRDVPPGALVVDYEARVGRAADPDPEEASTIDVIEYVRPSRYCDSDRLAAVAATHLGEVTGTELAHAATTWVRENIAYAPGSSDVTDGALEAYLSRQGVCRDSAQLVVTFLRARGLPARLVSVYAPGLDPMDFHAVAEVCLQGRWWVFDGTGLAPRQAMVRIATGRDAADTAFLTVLSGRTQLGAMTVGAVSDPELPVDDGTDLVALA